MRCVDQQPSSKPEVGDEGRDQQKEGDSTIVSRPEQEKGGIQDVADTGKRHDVSHPAREDTPQDDGESKETKEDTTEDCKRK